MLIQRTVIYEVEDSPFFYLAGPMTKVHDHNFHEFRRVEALLKADDLCVVSPYDLKSQPAPSEGGNPPASTSPQGLEMLRRDVNIVMDPDCAGIILLPGWEDSFGAGVETFIGEAWGRKLFSFIEGEKDYELRPVLSREDALSRFRFKQEFVERLGHTTPQGRSDGVLELDPLGAQRRVREVAIPDDLGTL